MAVNIENLSLLILGNGWLANGSAESLGLDGSIVHGARTLLASATVAGGSMKLLRHASDACLAQISFAGSIEATLKAQGELSVEVGIQMLLSLYILIPLFNFFILFFPDTFISITFIFSTIFISFSSSFLSFL